MIQLTTENWQLIKKINSDVNNNTKYRTDMTLYQKLEYWEPSGGYEGDCEDYALEKRKRLLDCKLFDINDIRLATCWVEGKNGEIGEGGYHAVLILVIENNDWVLDNRCSNPIKYHLLPYKWHKILIGNKWHNINS